ncbi:MAG: hypothetical protein CML29_09030 [Rhizobiales bacterium]|nr:hypothetical protein [Hyphomicrobiales bacterium]MBA70810.1 hypothetical protein [Hyphomicrobiales bacterium]|tara:strand:- start:394 stop:2844 length:2451 start_codon:yes stop_codon:yes gene_type:complete
MSIIKSRLKAGLCGLFFAGLIPAHGFAEGADTIVVFDGSGSMWGQIEGRTKIETARETLSTVLSEIPADSKIGLIAYGHRRKGACSDIETVVPVGPAGETVPRMISFANGMQPKGKTPLTDAVRKAAEELRFTENAATVVLVTDGIETCDADPCALGRELEGAGINFTAHVVGFGLSEDEGRQVQCLADTTGGLYLSANSADELGDALRQTVQAEAIPEDASDFGTEEAEPRPVTFFIRDAKDGPLIGIRHLQAIIENEDGTQVEPDAFKLQYPEGEGHSAEATLPPGRYVAYFQRLGCSDGCYKVRYPFEVPEGTGEHTIEAVISGSLVLNGFINPNLPYRKGDKFETAVGGSRPRMIFDIFPVVDGVKADEAIARAYHDTGSIPLAPGTYLIQGNLDNSVAAERIVEVAEGDTTSFDFSFDATRVFVDARQTDGFPVKRQTTYWFDQVPASGKQFIKGGGAGGGAMQPFYLPTGTWAVNVGGEGYGKRRSLRVVEVPGDFEDIRLKVGESEVLSEENKAVFADPGYRGCVEMVKVKYAGCLVEKADLSVGQRKAEAQGASEDDFGQAGNALSQQSAEPNGDRSEIRLGFGDPSDGVQRVLIDYPPGSNGEARIVLNTGWCGDEAKCGGAIAGISGDIVDALDSGQSSTFTDSWDVAKITVNPDGRKETIEINERGTIKRFSLLDRTGPGSSMGHNDEQADGDTPKGLEGLSGTDYVFAGKDGTPLAHVVLGPVDKPEAEVVLEPGWCGAGCTAESFQIEADKLALLEDETMAAATLSKGSFVLNFVSVGADKQVSISGRHGKATLRLFDTVVLQ